MNEEKLSKIIRFDRTLQAAKSAHEYLAISKTGALRIHFDTDGSPGLVIANTTLRNACINGLMVVAADVQQEAEEQLEKLLS